MSGFLLDTNCISELVRIKPEPRVVEWVLAADEKLLHVSVLAFGEIRKGVTLLPAGKKRDQLEQWLESELPARFAYRFVADQWRDCGNLGCNGRSSAAQRNHAGHHRRPHGSNGKTS